MRHRKIPRLGAWLLGLAVCGLGLAPAHAADLGAEVEQLARAGVSEDLMLGYIRSHREAATFAPADYQRLRDAGVGERAIAALMAHDRASREAAPAAPTATVPSTPSAAYPAPMLTAAPTVTLGDEEGLLRIVNHAPYALRVTLDPDARVLWVARASSAEADALPPGGETAFAMRKGDYKMQVVGRRETVQVKQRRERTTTVWLSSVGGGAEAGLFATVDDSERTRNGLLSPAAPATAYDIDDFVVESVPTTRIVVDPTPVVQVVPYGGVVTRWYQPTGYWYDPWSTWGWSGSPRAYWGVGGWYGNRSGWSVGIGVGVVNSWWGWGGYGAYDPWFWLVGGRRHHGWRGHGPSRPPIHRPPWIGGRPPYRPPTHRPPGIGGRPPIHRPPGIGGRPPIHRPPGIGGRPPTHRPPGIGGRPPVIQRPPNTGGRPPIINRPPNTGGRPPIIHRPPNTGGRPPIINRPPNTGGRPPIINRPPNTGGRPPIIQRPPNSGGRPPSIQGPTNRPPAFRPPVIHSTPTPRHGDGGGRSGSGPVIRSPGGGGGGSRGGGGHQAPPPRTGGPGRGSRR